MRIRAFALPLGATAALLAPVATASAVPNLFYGSTLEYPSGDGQASGPLAAGPDGNVWFGYTMPGGGGLNAMPTTGGALAASFPMPNALFPPPYTDPSSLVTGPDGRLWFLQGQGGSGAAVLGAMTTSGSYASYPLPAGSSAGDITSAGGALWVAAGNAILKVTTTGQVATQFAMPSGTTGASQLVVAGDGSVWFAAGAQGVPVIGHLIPSTGQMTFSNPAAPVGWQNGWSFAVSAMGIGPDGATWAVMTTQNPTGTASRSSVESFAANGSSTVLAQMSTPGCELACDLLSAMDGNAWFTSGNSVTRVTPQGGVTNYTVVTRPGNAQVSGPVIGPDKNLWFTDGVSGNVGVLSMPGGNPIPAPAMSMINGYRMGGAKRGKKLSVTFEAGQSAAGKSTVTISRGGRTVTLWSGNVRPGSTRTVSGTVPSSFPKGTAVVSLRPPKSAGRASTTVTVS